VFKRFALAILCALLIFYSVLLYKNNVLSAPASHEAIEDSFNASVDWLVRNRLDLYKDRNSYLWWMIGEAKINSGDPRLSDVYGEYLLHVRENPEQAVNPLNILFWPSSNKAMPPTQQNTTNLAPYQQYLYYSITCDSAWGNLNQVVQQHDPGFCWKHEPFRSACVTHQLLGYWYQRRFECHSRETLDPRVRKLQNYIHIQLLFDPRLVDVYVQRVLMLALTGDIEAISPSWIRRILDAQREDGGWDANDPYVSLSGGRSFGFSSYQYNTFLGIGSFKSQSRFHTTAQGILLMSILRREDL